MAVLHELPGVFNFGMHHNDTPDHAALTEDVAVGPLTLQAIVFDLVVTPGGWLKMFNSRGEDSAGSPIVPGSSKPNYIIPLNVGDKATAVIIPEGMPMDGLSYFASDEDGDTATASDTAFETFFVWKEGK